MKKLSKNILSILSLALAIVLPLQFALASSVPAGTHLQEHYDTAGKVRMDFDFIVPPDAPKIMPQMQMERIHFDKKLVQELVAKYGVEASKGERWWLNPDAEINPDFEIHFVEEYGYYGASHFGTLAPTMPLDESKPTHVQANNVVKAFLDELGLEYEYPFFVVEELASLGKEPTLIKVVPRFIVEGIPFHTTNGWSRGAARGVEANGDPTPMCVITVTEEGKIANIVMQNPVRLAESKIDPTPLKTWQEVLAMNKESIMFTYENTQDPAELFVLKEVELLMMTDNNNVAYPAWVYKFSLPPVPEHYPYYVEFEFDARTGDPV